MYSGYASGILICGYSCSLGESSGPQNLMVPKVLMTCPFTGPKIFWAGPNFFCAGPKNYLHIVAVTNVLCYTKRWFAFSKIGFCAGTKVFVNAVKFLSWLKQFGLAHNILGPVKGQGICLHKFLLQKKGLNIYWIFPGTDTESQRSVAKAFHHI